MAKFQFRLETVKRLREHTRDQRRADLAQALEALEQIERQQAEVAGHMQQAAQVQREASAPGKINVDRIMSVRRYQMLLAGQQQQLNEQARLIREEVERRRDALREADRQVRILDKLRERQWDRHQQAERKAEAKQLDEAASQSHNREGIY